MVTKSVGGSDGMRSGAELQAELVALHPGARWLSVTMLLENIERHDGPKRDLGSEWVNRLSDEFDPRLMDEIPVSQRADGVLYPLTGRHRLSAMFLRDIEMAPCRIITEMSREEEHKYWIAETTRRRRTSPLDRFRVGVVCDPDMKEIARIAESVGYHISMNSYAGTRRHPSCIDAVGALQSIYAASGSIGLLDVLSTLKSAWPHAPMAVSAAMLHGMRAFLDIYGPVLNRDRLTRRLASHTPKDVEEKARELKSLYEGRAHKPNRTAIGLMVIYNHGARGADRLDPSWAISYTLGGRKTPPVEQK